VTAPVVAWATRQRRLGRSAACTAAALVSLLAGCSTSSRPAAVTTATTSVSVSPTTAASASTTAAPQTSGVRTILSPVGLNVRAQASKSAPVLGTAAQGATLTVLGHVDAGDGWYQVKGATVTGFMSDKATLSAPGQFTAYSSTPLQFAALYPQKWTVAEAPPNSVVFHPPAGSDSIVVTTAATTSLLGRGRSGYRQAHDEQIVVCGVTGDLLTFEQANTASTAAAPAGGVVPERYLAQIHLLLDAQHALGIDANLADTSQLQTLRDFANSVSFAFPQCEQGTGPTTSTTAAH